MSKKEQDKSCYEPSWPEKMLDHHVDFLTGRLLTIIDALMIGEQNKATKDLIRSTLADFRMRNWKMFQAMETRGIKLPMAPLENLSPREL